MRPATVVGIILIVLGILGFIFGGVSFTKEKKVADVGPIELKTEKKETIPIPQILSGLAVVGGIVLVAVGSKRRP